MSELGQMLQKAREERGLSLNDIQETTKIRTRYLEAIESGDHTVLPGPFYVRAFVKSYAEAVGLDPDEVLRLYQHEMPAPPVETTVDPLPVRAPRRVKSQSSERLGKIGFNVVMWSFLILIVVVVWVFFINRQENDPETADDQTQITDEAAPPTATDTTGGGVTPVAPTPTTAPTPTQVATTVTFGSKVGRADQYDIGPAGTHKLEIKVSGGRNWVEVRKNGASGEKLFYANAEDGEVLPFDLTQPLYINVGRADLSIITVDGVPVPDGDRAGSKKLLLTPAEPEQGAEEQAGTEGTEQPAG